MAISMRNVKNKINATKKTSQITNAMNMVSASKLKKTENNIRKFQAYVDQVEDVISNVISSEVEFSHPLLEEREIKKTCFIIITSDRGLAGPFNNNIFRKVLELVDDSQGEDEYIFASLGTRGYNFLKKHKLPMVTEEMILLRDDVAFADLMDLIKLVIELYLNEEIDKVVICYNHFVNTLVQKVEVKTLLPIETEFNEKKSNDIYIFEGGIESILETLLPLYIESLIYGCVLDSKASEHASRMTAMKNATDNANEIIAELEVLYNRARQAEITAELTDIIGGTNATNR